MEIKIGVGADGEVEVTAMSMLEDLWHDYLHFKGKAEEAGVNGSRFTCKRYLRVALVVLLAYLEGVVNQWCARLLKERGDSAENQFKYLRHTCLDKKCEFLLRTIRPANAHNPTGLSLSTSKELRNQIVHLKPGNDLKLFESISRDLVAETELKIASWLDSVALVLGQERHPSTKHAAQSFGTLIGEIMSDEGSES